MSFLVDAHCHLNEEDYADAGEGLIQAFPSFGLLGAGVPGWDLASSEKALDLAHRHDRIFACCGTHPHDSDSYSSEVESRYRAMAEDPKVVAMGEFGLDYHYMTQPKAVQQNVFEAQLQLALDLGLPAVVHCREAAEDALAIVRNFPGLKILMHSFTDGPEAFAPFRDLGCYVSYGGILTFKNGEEVRAQARISDPDRILMETDGPYLSPVPRRGKLTKPWWAWYTLQVLARTLDRDPRDLADRVLANTLDFYDLEGALAPLKEATQPVDPCLELDF